MPEGQVLEFSRVTKRFGAITAVSEFSARVEPGVVTGFLGPNGAGKTTSLRILLGLIGATEGTATIGGVPYAKLRQPLQTVGAVLEASSFHPGRTAANHLKVYAQAAGIPTSRVDETLATVGLGAVGDRKVGGFSLGMRQRLGLAYALLGDPGVLVLDEPSNGLDPEGIKWMRGLLRQLARQGRTVLVSSHLLSEVQQTVDALLIISQGRLVFQGGLQELVDPAEYATVVDAPDRAALAQALEAAGMDFEVLRSGLTVRSVDTAQVGEAAAAAGVALSTLQRRGPGLEEVFLDLVNGVRVHASAPGLSPVTDGQPPVEEPVGDVSEAVPAEAVDQAVDAEPTEAEPADAEPAQAEPEPEPAEPEPAEPEPAEAGQPVQEDAAATDAAPEEAAPETGVAAGFAVASTGIIEVIRPADMDDEPEPAAAPEPDSEREPTAEDAGDRVWAMPAAAPHDEQLTNTVDEPAQDTVDEPAQDSADEPAQDSADEEDDRMKSDIEADRFFAAFDAHDESEDSHESEGPAESGEAPEPGEAPESGEAAESDGLEASDPPGPEPAPEPEPEPEPEADDAPGESGDEHDGGEQR
ncbi:MAG TPA: ATP-binding cassette domain-containing protein [Microbacterium sp.]|nr:ATP-binding cassette domain-containing protein [Microbacterium sp.]